jgi:twinkle protein
MGRANRHGLFTCRPDAKFGAVPDARGHILGFPYWDHDHEVGIKYRDTRSKRFWQSAGGVATFYGADVMDDAAVLAGEQALVIVEGELDKLAVETAGHPFVVSVPEGAPPPRMGRNRTMPEPSATDDMHGKFKFMFHDQDRLRAVKRFILAVDDDEPGKCLESEIIRRILAPRCSRVKYPEGCKDFNEVLLKHGREAVLRVLAEAKPYPLDGVYTLSDYGERDFVTYSSGIPNLDPHFKLFEGQFVVITGVPGHYKSGVVLQIAIEVAKRYGWNSLIYSPEMPVKPQLRGRLRKMIGGDAVVADAFIERHFRFIDHPPSQSPDDRDISVEEIIKRAAEAVMRDDIRLVIIDPWNEVEHAREPQELVSDYTGRAIRLMKQTAQQRKLLDRGGAPDQRACPVPQGRQARGRHVAGGGGADAL